MIYKAAKIEYASNGMGVSGTARTTAKKYYAAQQQEGQGNLIWSTSNNERINDLLAMDFANAEPRTRFKLKTGEVAEIRKSHSSEFYYIAAMRRGTYDILVLQTGMKDVDPKISKRRLESIEWGGKK